MNQLNALLVRIDKLNHQTSSLISASATWPEPVFARYFKIGCEAKGSYCRIFRAKEVYQFGANQGI